MDREFKEKLYRCPYLIHSLTEYSVWCYYSDLGVLKSISKLPFRVDFPFNSTNQGVHGGCSAAQLASDHSLLLHSSQIGCPEQLQSHAWLIEKDCNSRLQWGSVTCRSKCSTLYCGIQQGGWASAYRRRVSLCLSSALSRHFCCCVRRLNLIPSLLMRGRWTWPLWLRHRAASFSLEIKSLLLCFSTATFLEEYCYDCISPTGAMRWQNNFCFDSCNPGGAARLQLFFYTLRWADRLVNIYYYLVSMWKYR